MKNDRLKKAIKKAGYTGRSLSLKIGIHRTTLSQIIGGLKSTNERMELISEILGKKPKTLFGKSYTGDK